jgi:hypothetical protein
MLLLSLKVTRFLSKKFAKQKGKTFLVPQKPNGSEVGSVRIGDPENGSGSE